MSDQLTIESAMSEAPRAVVFRLTGSLDGRGGQQLMSACAPHKQAGLSMILNCERVNFISSSGIGVMLALSEDFRDRGLRLRIASPSAEVRMAIGLLNLDEFLSLDESEQMSMERLAA